MLAVTTHELQTATLEPPAPVRAPKANAFCERFMGSVRRECLDHLIVLGERHLLETLVEYARYFDEARTHQGGARKAGSLICSKAPRPTARADTRPRC